LYEDKSVQSREITVINLNNNILRLAVTTTILKPAGINEVLVTLMDISSIDIVRQKIAQSDKLSAIGCLAAGIAHEIKNPLGSIRGFTQILGEGISDIEPKKQYINIILEEVDRLDNVIKQLLDFASPSKGEFKPVNMINVVERVLQLAMHNMKSKDIQLTKHFDDVPFVMADGEKIIQAILNIVLNAVDAVDLKGKIACQVVHNKNAMTVDTVISNNGPVLSDEVKKRLFDPFFTTKDYGTGLGLSITYQIISRHDGQIMYNNLKNGEVCFTVSLPIKHIIAT